MVLILEKIDASPPCRAVMMSLDILGIKYQSRVSAYRTLPRLEDGDFILSESHAILTYLVSKYGAKEHTTYYPTDLKTRAKVDQRLFFDANVLCPLIREVFTEIFINKSTAPNSQQIADVKEAYGIAEKYLTRSEFIATDFITVADVSCVSSVCSLDVFVTVGEEFPKLRAWWRELQAQEWYIKANNPGLSTFTELMKREMAKNGASV